MQDAIRAGFDKMIRLKAPLLTMTKAQVIELGSKLGVPFEHTWSCYKGCEFQCGVCSSCVERRGAFIEADIVDPTEYFV